MPLASPVEFNQFSLGLNYWTFGISMICKESTSRYFKNQKVTSWPPRDLRFPGFFLSEPTFRVGLEKAHAAMELEKPLTATWCRWGRGWRKRSRGQVENRWKHRKIEGISHETSVFSEVSHFQQTECGEMSRPKHWLQANNILKKCRTPAGPWIWRCPNCLV